MTRPAELSEFADYWKARAQASGETADRIIPTDGTLAAILFAPLPEPEPVVEQGSGPAYEARLARARMRELRKPLTEMTKDYMDAAEKRARAEAELLHNAYEAEWPGNGEK